jgi:general secretion pathway protein J
MSWGIGDIRRQAGITLVELVVALAVVSLTLAAAVTAMRLLGRSSDRGARHIAQQEMLSRGIDALRRDIERLQRVVRHHDGNSEFAFYGDDKSLIFVVVEPPVPSAAGPYFIQYTIEQGDAAGALVRSRTPYDAAAKDLRRLASQDDVTVLEGPYSFRFSYSEFGEGRQRWLARWQNPARIPELIRLEILSRQNGLELSPLIFRPRADAEQGCIRPAVSKGTAPTCSLRTAGTLAREAEAAPQGQK